MQLEFTEAASRYNMLYNTDMYSQTDAFKFGITMMTFSWLLILLFGQTVLKWLNITPGLF